MLNWDNYSGSTLQYTIQKAVEGKVVNASLYAAELAAAIRSSVSMPDKSVEERAAYREMALKQAQYIAEHYFEDEQEAASFLNEIMKYDVKPFKKYSNPISNDNDVSFYALANKYNKYMDKDDLERFIRGEGNPVESAKFLSSLTIIK